MEMQSYGHGVPSWVDVGCRDTVAEAAFYNALNWQIATSPQMFVARQKTT